jgi:hypothetical protein
LLFKIELYAFFVVLIYMEIVKRSNKEDYWDDGEKQSKQKSVRILLQN